MYNDSFMDSAAILWYNDFIQRFKTDIEKLYLNFDVNDEIIQTVVHFTPESKEEWVRIHDKITDMQNSDEENEYMKSMLPKQKSYIPRFALLLNAIYTYVDTDANPYKISRQSILNAEKVSQYFIDMAKIVKNESREKMELKRVSSNGSSAFDKFKMMYQADPELNRSTVSEMLEVSRKTLYQWIKKIEKK